MSPPPRSVLFVCSGNICRSPAAEAVLRAMLPGGSAVRVDSAGIGSWHLGARAHPRSIAEGERRGYALVGRARQLESGDLERFDLIVGMDGGHVRELRRLHALHRVAPAAGITLFRDLDPASETGLDLDDPYNLPASAYGQMYDVIEPTCAELAQALKKL